MIRSVERSLLLLLLLLASVVGCGKGGPTRAAVSGTVTLDGKPLEQGDILLTPLEGVAGIAAGGRIEHGQYRLTAADGPFPGRYRVEVRAVRKTGKKTRLSQQAPLTDELVEVVPSQFNSASTLKVDIRPGDNTDDFNLTSK